MDGAALFGQEAENLFGELCSWRSKAQEGVNVGGLLLGRCRSRRKADVERKAKGTADGRDTADDVSAIYGATVPSVSGSVGGFHENGIGATIVGSDGNSFIEEAMKMLDADGLVIAASGDMKIDVENSTDFFEETFEGTAVIDNYQAAKADFQKDVLDEESSKIVGADVIGGGDENKTG